MKCKRALKVFRQNLFLEIAVALLVSITFFCFGPLEMILAEPLEYWFTLSNVAPIVAIATMACALLLILIFFVFAFFGEKTLHIVLALAGGIGLVMYIQGNWMFVSYGNMDGSSIDWSLYSNWAIINSLIWVVIIAAIVVALAIKPRVKSILSWVFIGVAFWECSTLATVYFTSYRNVDKTSIELTNKDELVLSADQKNIVVLLADAFDGEDFLPALSEEPDLEPFFDGFTFYENTCGTSQFSEESGITQLTGNQLEVGLSFTDNINKAYETSSLYSSLADNNFLSYVYTTSKMVSPSISGLIENSGDSSSQFNDYNKAFKYIYRMVAFRYMPHIIKKNFWYTTAQFNELKDTSIFSDDNIKLNNLIEERGVTTRNTGRNIYQFFWIQGPHPPAKMDRYCQPLDTLIMTQSDDFTDSQFEQTIGVVRLFTNLISSLKNAGIYDNTIIILTADHGWDNRANPLLMIKPMNAHGDLQVSNAPVSLIEDYLPTLLYFISDESDEKTVYDLTEDQARSRPFYVYNINSEDRTYNDRETVYYDEKAFTKVYVLNSTLQGKEIYRYCTKGIDYDVGANSEYVWSTGHEAEFCFDIGENSGDLNLEIHFIPFHAPQSVNVYADNHLVSSFVADKEGDALVLIPGEYITQEELTIKFEFPDACSPLSLEISKDPRLLALDFTSMRLSKADGQIE